MISSSSRDRIASSMVVVGLLGFLRRFPSLFPSITSCFSEQISVAMVIPWVSTTVCVSLLPESFVSATKVLLTVISIESTVSGKNTFRPRVVFIILSLGWCVFVSNLGVYRPKVEWRCICRNFIFLLVMEGNRYRRLLKITLGIVEDMNNVESTDPFCLALMKETHEGWHYMLSMEVMEEELAHVVMKRITQAQFFKETLVRKCWCHYVYIPELAWDTSALMLRFVKRGHSQKLLSPIRNKEKSNMKLDNNRSFDRLASKATLRKASSNSLMLYFLLVYGAYICVCNNCISLIMYVFVITLLV